MNFNSLGRIKSLWLLMFLLVSISALKRLPHDGDGHKLSVFGWR